MRFAIATLGCKVNQYDSAIIEARLVALGMERTEFDRAAEVYVVNTCTVTHRADAESLRLLWKYQLPLHSKFVPPTIADGKVFAPSSSPATAVAQELFVFGL